MPKVAAYYKKNMFKLINFNFAIPIIESELLESRELKLFTCNDLTP